MKGKTLRQHGLRIGHLEAGAANAITDVEGVCVGHVTVARDEAAPPVGRGIARTGVTAILPGGAGSAFRHPIPAGATAEIADGGGKTWGTRVVINQGTLKWTTAQQVTTNRAT